MNLSVVIVAGGNGSRMQTEVPKQFLLLKGEPILAHTIRRFYSFCNEANIIVVLPKEQIDTWTQYIVREHFEIVHTITTGGKTRYHSVRNGLSEITNDTGIVMIHDGVRPMVDLATLKRCLESAKKHSATVPTRQASESLRRINDDNSTKSVDRSKFLSVQTPQTFKTSLIKECYKKEYKDCFTDDASVAENSGIKIECVEGNVENIKITYPSDLKIAEALINSIS
ncbi:MAG: 2-C-methyl-D-erythritol 4-phosphate cytidylyltransferase [Bacteroidales bacterium]